MTTITDPKSWLATPSGPRGRTRGAPLPEPLCLGDVNAAGDLVHGGPVAQTAGCRLVSPFQAHAAAYYGWKDSGMRLYEKGQTLVQIYRGLS